MRSCRKGARHVPHLSARELESFRRHLVRLGPKLPLFENAVDDGTRAAPGTERYIGSLLDEVEAEFSLSSRQVPPVESRSRRCPSLTC